MCRPGIPNLRPKVPGTSRHTFFRYCRRRIAIAWPVSCYKGHNEPRDAMISHHDSLQSSLRITGKKTSINRRVVFFNKLLFELKKTPVKNGLTDLFNERDDEMQIVD